MIKMLQFIHGTLNFTRIRKFVIDRFSENDYKLIFEKRKKLVIEVSFYGFGILLLLLHAQQLSKLLIHRISTSSVDNLKLNIRYYLPVFYQTLSTRRVEVHCV